MHGVDIYLPLLASLAESHQYMFIHNTVSVLSFKLPDVPTLLQILNGVQPSDLVPKGSIYPLPGQKSVEISILALPLALAGSVCCSSICRIIIGILYIIAS
jgi:iron transport multicopper oxidase